MAKIIFNVYDVLDESIPRLKLLKKHHEREETGFKGGDMCSWLDEKTFSFGATNENVLFILWGQR